MNKNLIFFTSIFTLSTLPIFSYDFIQKDPRRPNQSTYKEIPLTNSDNGFSTSLDFITYWNNTSESTGLSRNAIPVVVTKATLLKGEKNITKRLCGMFDFFNSSTNYSIPFMEDEQTKTISVIHAFHDKEMQIRGGLFCTLAASSNDIFTLKSFAGGSLQHLSKKITTNYNDNYFKAYQENRPKKFVDHTFIEHHSFMNPGVFGGIEFIVKALPFSLSNRLTTSVHRKMIHEISTETINLNFVSNGKTLYKIEDSDIDPYPTVLMNELRLAYGPSDSGWGVCIGYHYIYGFELTHLIDEQQKFSLPPHFSTLGVSFGIQKAF